MCQTDPPGQHYKAGKRMLEIIMACTLLTANACNRSQQEPAVQPADRSKARTEAPILQRPLPDCPPENSSKPSSAASDSPGEATAANHHHRVVLTWNASQSSSGPTDPTVGYCLYRSRKGAITANKLDRCQNCNRINLRPIVGTACVDNDVRDGHTYYYAAASIRPGSQLSSFSNKTTAIIPTNAKSPQSASPYPSCEGENSTTAAPQARQ